MLNVYILFVKPQIDIKIKSHLHAIQYISNKSNAILNTKVLRAKFNINTTCRINKNSQI